MSRSTVKLVNSPHIKNKSHMQKKQSEATTAADTFSGRT